MQREKSYKVGMSFLVSFGGISVVYAEGFSMMDEKALFDAIDANRQQYVAFLSELIQASENGEAAVQSVVAKRFGERGCEG